MEPHARRVQANGITMNFAEWEGEGEPVVLLHGPAGNGRWWDGVARRLAPRRRVLAPDLRGHGDSDKPDTGYDLTTLATDTLAFLSALGVERAALAGHAAAGKVILMAAALAPERVTGLVPIEPPPPFALPPPPPPGPNERPLFIFEAELGPFPHWDGALQVVRSLPQYTPWHDDLEAALRHGLAAGADGALRGKMPVSVLEAMLRGTLGEDATALIAWVTTPTHVILSEASAGTISGDPRAVFAGWLPRAPVDVTVVAGASHWVHASHPDAIATVIEGLRTED